MENKFIHTIKSTILCIKYPFLYPRNRFTGLHYTSWSLYKKLYGEKNMYKTDADGGLYDKAFLNKIIFLDTPDPDGSTHRIVKHTKNHWYAFEYYFIKFLYKYFVPFFHCIPTYTEWDVIEEDLPGWYKAFGKQYLAELGAAYKKLSKESRKIFGIHQIKEKYGTLRVYVSCGSDEIFNIIQKYEDLSAQTCICCGEPATKATDNYILPYCDSCFEKYHKDEPYIEIKNN